MARTHIHYLDHRGLRGDGRVVLYKRADHQNPKWTVRLKIPKTSGFVVRSTKTADEFEARRFAEDLYYELEGRAHRGEPIRAPSFRRVFEQWSRSLTEGRDRTEKYVDGNFRRVEIWMVRYFAETRIDLVNENALMEYVEWRLASSRRPALSTLRNERTALNRMLRFAKRRGCAAGPIEPMPILPRFYVIPSLSFEEDEMPKVIDGTKTAPHGLFYIADSDAFRPGIPT